MKAIDITGQRFGRLVAQAEAGRDNFGEITWTCHCDCGETTIVRSSKLRRSSTVSCGCFKAERIGALKRSHMGSKTAEYRSYRAMLRRCYDPKHRAYPWYGGRGIKVFDDWLDFGTFVKDMGPRPDGYTLDRVDNDKDYGPKNCRWAPWLVQSTNKRKHLPPLPLLSVRQ